ncbi:MAG: methionine--tRNA ligase [Deltaproteobacteria bacterium]|nr:MAG: methionine--tRNA ligase [Deltaproteobacteria bacterium]
MTTYITTPIYYVNAQPHLGHAYTTIVADSYYRFRRLCGGPVRFQTGTDEHGDKIVEAAEKQGVNPAEYVDRISTMFQDTWPQLDIKADRCIRTTDVDHIAVVQRILQQVYDKGDIYFDKYSGLYCKGCERYLTEKELVDGNCPDHQKPPELIEEENYFFRMSKYRQQLIAHIESHREFITPERYRNEVVALLREPLGDLCISRPKSRLTWGIELPFDNNFVTYVWFDALINYLTGLGYPEGEDFETFWPCCEHLIAKDILKPHAVFWPTMLLSLGVPLYKKLHVHGYWNVDETKMSKSLGNVVRPAELVERYGVDTLRYFLLREMSFGLDSSFSADLISGRHNSDLANDLGNLFSRALAMVNKYRNGVVPAPRENEAADVELRNAAEKMLKRYIEHMGAFRFHLALQAVWEFVGLVNKYIVENEPWALAKEEKSVARLDSVLYTVLEGLRFLTLVLQPIMPRATGKMSKGLGLTADSLASFEEHGVWGGLAAGTRLAETEALFPRLEKQKETKATRKQPETKQQQGKAAATDGLISFDQFREMELRVAEIVAAEPVKNSKRLYKLVVKAPEQRVIVAGIAEHYRCEELLGKKVVVVANLKPAKLMGILSEGMVLAAKEKTESGERLVLATVDGEIAPGSFVA